MTCQHTQAWLRSTQTYCHHFCHLMSLQMESYATVWCVCHSAVAVVPQILHVYGNLLFVAQLVQIASSCMTCTVHCMGALLEKKVKACLFRPQRQECWLRSLSSQMQELRRHQRQVSMAPQTLLRQMLAWHQKLHHHQMRFHHHQRMLTQRLVTTEHQTLV